jgi:hypothetical protein
MKKVIGAMALLAIGTLAAAADWGSLTLNVGTYFMETGSFTDTAEFTTTDTGPVVVTIKSQGHVSCTGGRGANCAYYQTTFSSVAVVDAGNNSVCTPVMTLLVFGNPNNFKTQTWTCSAPALPAGTYSIRLSGESYYKTSQGTVYVAPNPYYILVSGT